MARTLACGASDLGSIPSSHPKKNVPSIGDVFCLPLVGVELILCYYIISKYKYVFMICPKCKKKFLLSNLPSRNFSKKNQNVFSCPYCKTLLEAKKISEKRGLRLIRIIEAVIALVGFAFVVKIIGKNSIWEFLLHMIIFLGGLVIIILLTEKRSVSIKKDK